MRLVYISVLVSTGGGTGWVPGVGRVVYVPEVGRMGTGRVGAHTSYQGRVFATGCP